VEDDDGTKVALRSGMRVYYCAEDVGEEFVVKQTSDTGVVIHALTGDHEITVRWSDIYACVDARRSILDVHNAPVSDGNGI